jgi:tetratricopeptide (TPR) repeat protein
VHRACTPCHRQGQPVPFELRSYDDVQKRRDLIAEVVQARVMPPWLPTQGEFAGERRLTDAELATIARWIAADAPRGDVAAEPAPPVFPSGWQLREPDLVVPAPLAIELPARGPDLVRNLVLPIDAGRLRYVAAVEIRPGSRAVHHAILAVDGTRSARQRDAEDAEPGFPGMAMAGAVPPDGNFLGWTPGKRVHELPPGFAWRLQPGHDLVLQLHLVPTGKPETVQPRIGLWFTDVPTAVHSHPLALYSERIDIAAGDAAFVLRDHFVLPVPATVHALYPHAHYLGRRMRGTATLPDGGERVLFAIDAWDFDWQDDYRLRAPLALPAGTRLAIEYVYDNSTANPNNPHRPPRRVTFGQQSTDEMGTLTLTVTVADAAARRRLVEAEHRRDLEKRPWDHVVMARLAKTLREQGRVAEARAAVDRALALAPDEPESLLELGMCQERAGDAAAAERSYERALRRDPDLAAARLQLGGLLARAGEPAAALVHFEAAVAALPNFALAHNNLATACFALDRLEPAERHYRRALDLDPDYFFARFNLGRVLAGLGRRGEARVELERAAALKPGDAAVAKALQELDGR